MTTDPWRISTNFTTISIKPKLIHSRISKTAGTVKRRTYYYQDTNNNNKKSIKFINVISSDTLSYKKNICLLIDSKKSQNFCLPNEIEEYYKTSNNINEMKQMNEKKINKLFKGVPTANINFESTDKNVNNTQGSEETNDYTFEYHFYSYFYPSEVDEGLLPFLEHFDKQEKSLNSHDDDLHQTNNIITDYGGDRRLKSVENKCRVRIKIGNLEEKLIKGLPRRKVTLIARKAENVATALSCLEDCIPELFENALFTKPLECKTQKWPNSKGVLIRHVKKSSHFHKRALNCPLMSSIWFKSIDPRRVFPFGNLNTKRHDINRSNEYNTIFPTNTEDINDVTELTTKLASSSNAKQSLENKFGEISEQNKNNNQIEEKSKHSVSLKLQDKKDFSKYLKFPFSKKSNHLFQCNILGEPTCIKFKEYLKVCKCFVDNIKCRMDKFGTIYNIVKIRYKDPSQLVKLFLLLNYKIKY